jgi:serine/threonine protein kinase
MAHTEQRVKEMGRVFVHCDIKPENIMVTKDKVVKVTDFGLVQTVREVTFAPEAFGDADHGRFSVVSQQGICGTPFYMSPEQVLQGADLLKQLGIMNTTPEIPAIDLHSDMYAFGCVLDAMVAGTPPFWKLPFEPSHYFSQMLYEEPAPVSSGDREFDEVIGQLLRKEPDKRGYRSFVELEEVLQSIYQQVVGERMKEETTPELEAVELVNRGLSFHRLGQPERALTDYTTVIDLNPEDADAYLNRGNAYRALRQLERAIADFRRFIELAPLQYAQHIATVKQMIHQLEELIGRK